MAEEAAIFILIISLFILLTLESPVGSVTLERPDKMLRR